MHGQIRWLAAGLWVTACGPLPPGADTAGTTSASSMTTGDPSSETLPTSGPEPTTTATSGTSETSNTSGPPPQCEKDSDCSGFCEYCVEGECYDAVGCCHVVPDPNGVEVLRCQGYECYGDEDCEEGQVCDFSPGWCVPKAAIPVCDRQPLALSVIGLQGAPSAVALVDLDGDGLLDLAAALPEQGLVEVALGDGQGGFAASATFATGLSPGDQRLAVADFNLDGSPDLALILKVPVGDLSLLFGQDAVFAAPVLSTHGSDPEQVWAGDFDGDGRPDVVTRDGSEPPQLTLRPGDGMGGFGDALGFTGLNSGPFAAAVGALVDDPSRLDLVLTLDEAPGADIYQHQPGTGLVWHGNLSAPGWTRHTSLTVGDFDGDGIMDIVGARMAGDVALVAAWRIEGPAEELVIAGEVALGPVADVDGDQIGDIVTASPLPPAVGVIFMEGSGAPCLQSHALASATGPGLLVAGDVDGDGKADVIAGTVGEASLTLLRSGP